VRRQVELFLQMIVSGDDVDIDGCCKESLKVVLMEIMMLMLLILVEQL
jgi:hypothetical protein